MSMKASELRIGNLIWHDKIQKEDKSCVVTGVISDSVWVKYSFQDQLGSNEICIDCKREAKPIPLTEEWLLKFGFHHLGNLNHAYYLNDKIRTSFSFGNYARCDGDPEAKPHLRIDGISSFPKEIKYIHQLQNLYFTLTGEELTIKEQ